MRSAYDQSQAELDRRLADVEQRIGGLEGSQAMANEIGAIFADACAKPLTVRFSRLHPDAKMPTYGKPGDVGMDLYALEDCAVALYQRNVRTGIAIELPEGYEAQIRPRSSTEARGLRVFLGTIDTSYRGELIIGALPNHVNDDDHDEEGNPVALVYAGDRIAQLVIVPVPRVHLIEVQHEELSKTERNTSGFGSSGR